MTEDIDCDAYRQTRLAGTEEPVFRRHTVTDPKPARRTWRPVEPSVPGWEREARRRFRPDLLAAVSTPVYTGPSRLRRKANERIRHEVQS